MTDETPRRRPDSWGPGSYLPPAYPGYTRDEAIRAVGPGWADLAGRAWDVAEQARARVSQVKEKWGALTVYCDNFADEATYRWVYAKIDRLATESRSTCEACGRDGRRWPLDDEERARLAGSSPRSGLVSTLCERCGWRRYYEDARGWAETIGEWTPASDGTPSHPDPDDDDPPEPWRGGGA